MSLDLYRNGSIYSPADPFATAMLVENGTVAWIGSESAAGALLDARMTEIDLQGALVAPAFVDSHVHLGALGANLAGLDLGGASNAADILDLVSSAAGTGDGIIQGFRLGRNQVRRCIPSDARGARSARHRAARSTCPESTSTRRWSARSWPSASGSWQVRNSPAPWCVEASMPGCAPPFSPTTNR